ncbi:MAG TPA: DUF1588 domain-containing protein [Polyangiaceae bacterium]|jgi:hypothetical protein|nr:DUF1588 domain-containing protein [Polyangiaceae bacterium]
MRRRSLSSGTHWRVSSLFLVAAMSVAAASSGAGCAKSQAPAGYDNTTAGSSGTSGSGGTSGNGGATGSAGTSGASGAGTTSGSTAADGGPSLQGVGIGIFADTCTSGTPSVPYAPMRRVTRVEYDNMVRDLLGDTSHPSVTFQIPAEALPAYGVNLPLSNTYNQADTTAVTQYLFAAEAVAANAVADTNRMNNVILAGIASCSAAHDDTCASDFIQSWANRAYRGQLDATETQGLMTVYSDVKGMVDWTTGIQAVITAVLESPRFLYVFEFGAGNPTGNVIALSSTEVGARMAFFLWRSVPDTKVMADAAAGMLSTTDGIAQEAQYMLTAVNPITQTPYAQDALVDFTNQMLQLSGIPAKDAQFTDYNANSALGGEMYDEARLDVSQLVLSANGSLTDLLTSTSTYLSTDLATYYGLAAGSGATGASVKGPVTGTSFTQTSVPNRNGILMNGGLLATMAHSTLPSLVWRGKVVRENFLCDPIGAPPANFQPASTAPAPDAGTTTRDLLEMHLAQCPFCHELMDPIGVAFDNFNAAGQYQSTDANGFTPASAYPPVDSSGQVNAPGAIINNVAIAGAPETGAWTTTFQTGLDFVTQLAASGQGQECFALEELRYALGRVETPQDACSAQAILSAFTTGKLNIQGLLVAVLQSDAMRYRTVESTGSSCQ